VEDNCGNVLMIRQALVFGFKNYDATIAQADETGQWSCQLPLVREWGSQAGIFTLLRHLTVEYRA
jgi:hypothetical protein